LDDNLDDSLELVSVADAASDRNRDRTRNLLSPSHRRLDTISLPLNIAVKGPADESDYALSYIMDALQDNKEDIARKLESLDWDSFKDASLSIESYDPTSEARPGTELVEMEETAHPVRLNFENMPDGYRLSQYDQASIKRFVKELLDDNLDDSLELVSVADAASDRNRDRTRNLLSPSHRRLDTISLPLNIAVKGPADKSDFALAYIMDALEVHKEDLVRKLEFLDWASFKSVDLSFDTYDFNTLSEPSKVTDHPVQLIFDNIRSNYRLPRADREAIIRFVKQRIGSSLDDAFDLIEVSYAAGWNGRSLLSTYRLSLPLLIRVRGSPDVSGFALSYILQAIRDNIRDIELYVKSLDDYVFMNTIVSVETYDFNGNPESNNPATSGVMDEEAPNTPWWVWLLVVIAIILFTCCFCVCCFSCAYRYKKSKETYQKSDDEIIIKASHSRSSSSSSMDFAINHPTMLMPYNPHLGEQNRTLQIMPPQTFPTNSFEERVVYVPADYSVITRQSAITEAIGEDPSSDMTLVRRDALLSLQPPKHFQICPDPNLAYYDDVEQSYTTASVMPGRGNEPPEMFLVHEANEAQSRAVQDDPSGLYRWEEEQSISTQQQLAIHSVASVNNDSNALLAVHEGSENKSHVAVTQDPRGVYFFDDQQSYAAQSQSYVITQDPREMHGSNEVSSFTTEPPYSVQSQSFAAQEARTIASSFMTQPTASSTIRSVKSRSSKKKKLKMAKLMRAESMQLRQSGGVESHNGADDFYYGHSNTFHVV